MYLNVQNAPGNETSWITREVMHAKRKLKRVRKACSLNHSLENRNNIRRLAIDLKQLIEKNRYRFHNITLKTFLSEVPNKFWRYISAPVKPHGPHVDNNNHERKNEFLHVPELLCAYYNVFLAFH